MVVDDVEESCKWRSALKSTSDKQTTSTAGGAWTRVEERAKAKLKLTNGYIYKYVGPLFPVSKLDA